MGATLADQYRIEEVLGRGGMGVVYRARQVTVDRDVAIKVLKQASGGEDTILRQRFENESKIISRLRHPNTLRLFDCLRTEDDSLFIVTELLSGTPLSTEMKKGPLPIRRILRIMQQVCGSLSEAHASGIIHRDLKPANIFLDRVGNEDVVKVLDFGIAKLCDAQVAITTDGIALGTPLYMSPEQAMGKEVDQRSDVYSLGVVLYFMIVGDPPFRASTPIALLNKHISEAPPLLSARVPTLDLPPDLEDLVMKMLGKKPDDRPRSMEVIRERIILIEQQITSSRLEVPHSAPTKSAVAVVESQAQISVAQSQPMAVQPSQPHLAAQPSGPQIAQSQPLAVQQSQPMAVQPSQPHLAAQPSQPQISALSEPMAATLHNHTQSQLQTAAEPAKSPYRWIVAGILVLTVGIGMGAWIVHYTLKNAPVVVVTSPDGKKTAVPIDTPSDKKAEPAEPKKAEPVEPVKAEPKKAEPKKAEPVPVKTKKKKRKKKKKKTEPEGPLPIDFD